MILESLKSADTLLAASHRGRASAAVPHSRTAGRGPRQSDGPGHLPAAST